MEKYALDQHTYLHSTPMILLYHPSQSNSTNLLTANTSINASGRSIGVHNDPNYELSPAMKGIMISMYTAIAFLAMCGNVGVCYVVKYILTKGSGQHVQIVSGELSKSRFENQNHNNFSNITIIKRTLHRTPLSVTNLFIMHLAIADILMALLCIPFSFVADQILGYWPFGPIMCPIVSYAQAISVMISAYVMVVISIDRYAVVMFPLRPKMTSSQARIALTAVYAWAFAIPLPIAILSHVDKLREPALEARELNLSSSSVDEYKNVRCIEDWPKGTNRQAYSISLLLIQYVIPLIILTFTYAGIGWRMWGSRTPGEAQAGRDAKMAKSKMKLIKMMITVVIIFGLCWLPLNTLIVVSDYNPKIFYYEKIHYVWFFCHWLAMSHSCCNPFIYCWMNSKFRRGFRHLYLTFTCRSPTSSNPPSGHLEFRQTFNTSIRNSTLRKKKSPSRTGPSANGLISSDLKNKVKYETAASNDFDTKLTPDT